MSKLPFVDIITLMKNIISWMWLFKSKECGGWISIRELSQIIIYFLIMLHSNLHFVIFLEILSRNFKWLWNNEENYCTTDDVNKHNCYDLLNRKIILIIISPFKDSFCTFEKWNDMCEFKMLVYIFSVWRLTKVSLNLRYMGV